jgi:hypothetical protein
MKYAFWILVALVVIAILAIKYLPWWALILILVGGALLLRWGAKVAVKQAFLLPFKAKGKVLQGAQVQVHQVQSVGIPVLFRDADLGEAEYADRRSRYHQLKWYSVDVSILPKAQGQVPFPAWEPGEMLLVPPGSRVTDLESLSQMESAEIHDYALYRNNDFAPDHEGKHLGAQRIKYIVGIEPEVKQLQFRYYLERFGQVEFPDRLSPDRQLKPA